MRNYQREAFAWWLATDEGDVEAHRLGRGREITLTVPGRVHVDDGLLEGNGSGPDTVTAGSGEQRVRVFV